MNKNKIGEFAKFVLPFSFWLFLFKAFIAGKSFVSGENFYFYAQLKFYLDNLRQGIFPLWNPFVIWGSPTQISLSYFGAFNPIWLLIPVLNAFGLTVYQAYVSTIIIYFFVGMLGFYLLVRTLLGDPKIAYAGFLLLTFSSLSIPMFKTMNPLILFVPGVWFFYFLFQFFKAPEKRFLVGMTFSFMLIASTYIPFYFLTVFLFMCFIMLALYHKNVPSGVGQAGAFVLRNRFTTFLCLGALVVSLIYPLEAFLRTSKNEVIVPSRHREIHRALEEGAALTYEMVVKSGGLASRMSFSDLFDNLDQIYYGNDGFFYVSIFAYLMLAMGAFIRLNKKIAALILLNVMLFLFALGNVSPIYPFIFKYIPYLKFFRNLHYFIPFILGCFVLLVCEQFRLLLDSREKLANTRIMRLWLIAIIHLCAIIFLNYGESVIRTSYVSVVLSWVLFSLLMIDSGKFKKFLMPLIFMGMVIQPAEVLIRHNSQATRYGSQIIRKTVTCPIAKPEFSHTRSFLTGKEQTSEEDLDTFYTYYIRMKDSPGTLMGYFQGFPTRWAYYLYSNISKAVLYPYVRNKFYVYDYVETVESDEESLPKIENAMRHNLNVAFASQKDADKDIVHAGSKNEHLKLATVIDGPSDTFKVSHFTVNSIQFSTDFPQNKFLVYTDSFDNDWVAFLNGQPAKIYRANIAFKGIKLPAGRNDIQLRYGSPSRTFAILAVFISFFIYTIFLFLRK